MRNENLILVNFRATREERENWQIAWTHTHHRNKSRWMREVLNKAAAEMGVIELPEFPQEPDPPKKALLVAQQLLKRAVEAKAEAKKKTTCVNRVPKGAFCKKCGRIHP